MSDTISENQKRAFNGAAAPLPSGQSAQPSPEMLARLAELRSNLQLGVGQVVLALMNLPRYRHQTLADLQHLVIEPLMRDRVAIARRERKDDASVDDKSAAGIAIWATVSAAVDAKLTEQTKAGVFPLRLAPEDWVSGDTVWLLDVFAADRKHATAVLANFRQLSGDRPVRIHPIVARSVEPGLLDKMRVKPAEDGDAKAEPTAGATASA